MTIERFILPAADNTNRKLHKDDLQPETKLEVRGHASLLDDVFKGALDGFTADFLDPADLDGLRSAMLYSALRSSNVGLHERDGRRYLDEPTMQAIKEDLNELVLHYSETEEDDHKALEYNRAVLHIIEQLEQGLPNNVLTLG